MELTKHFQTHYSCVFIFFLKPFTCVLLLFLKGIECYNSNPCIESVAERSTMVLSDNHYLSIYILFVYIDACLKRKINGIHMLSMNDI